MNPEDALKILDLATSPQAMGRLSRVDFANIETALATLRDAVQSMTPVDDADETQQGQVGA